MNPLVKALRDRIIKPEVEKETAHLRKQLNQKNVQLEEKSFEILSVGSKPYVSNWEVRQLTRQYVSWAYANITAIAEKVASVEFELFQVDSKGENMTEISQHPLLELLSRVNDHQTKWDLIYSWTCTMLSQGEAAWYLMGKKNEFSEPLEIWPLQPEYLKIIPGDLSQNQFIKSYEYRIPGKETQIFEPWEILFFKMPHPTNRYRGYGVLEAAITDVQIDYHATEYNKSFFQNFARPDGVLMNEGKMSDEVFARTMAQWETKYQGKQNAGKTAILEGGMKYEAISQSAKDMDFLQQQTWIRDKIMAMFKNTKTILGIVEDVNRANAEASEATWLKHNIKPKMQRLADYINEFLVPVYGNNLILGFFDPVPESEEQRQLEYKEGVDKWLTRNEIREELGRDPVEGGDFLFVPITNIPITSSGEDATLPDINDADDQEPKMMKLKVNKGKKNIKLLRRYSGQLKVVNQRIHREKQLDKVLAKVMRKYTYKHLKKQVKGIKADGQLAEQTKQQRWELFVKLAGIFENQAVKIIEAVLNKHRDKVLQLLEKYKPVKKGLETKGVDDYLPDDDEYVTVSINALTPIIRALVEEQGGDTLDFLGSPLRFDFDRAIERSVRRFIKEASGSYVRTVRERIARLLKEGITAGESIQQLQKRIRDEYAFMTRRSAVRIARTETIRASNFATEEAFKQSQIVTGKQWFTAEDERVDDECAALEGKIVELDDNFMDLDNGPAIYSEVGYPPIHPNCRCTISPVILNRSLNGVGKKGGDNTEPIITISSKSKLKPNADLVLTRKLTQSNEEMQEKFSKLEKELSDSVEELIKMVDDKQ